MKAMSLLTWYYRIHSRKEELMHTYSVNDLVGNLSAVKALQSGSCPTLQRGGKGKQKCSATLPPLFKTDSVGLCFIEDVYMVFL